MKGHQTIPKEVPMKELKKGINEVLAQTAVDITELTGCFMLWGEVELPECLRVEEKKMVMNCEDCNVRRMVILERMM